MKTVSATFAAGMVCGAVALVVLSPSPERDAPPADKAQADKVPVAVVSPTSVPCKEQVWPNIDRRCMRWTAESWTAGNSGSEPSPAASPEPPAARPADQSRTAAAKPAVPPAPAQAKNAAQPAPQPEARRVDVAKDVAKSAAPPQEAPPQAAPQQAAPQQQAAQVEPRRVDPPASAPAPQATSPAAGEATAARPSQHAQQTRKSARKTRVARSRDGDHRDYRDTRDYSRDYREGRDYRDFRESRRVARAWGNEDSSDFFPTRRVIIRPVPRQDSFFRFGD